MSKMNPDHILTTYCYKLYFTMGSMKVMPPIFLLSNPALQKAVHFTD
jgi:hypothetical protein